MNDHELEDMEQQNNRTRIGPAVLHLVKALQSRTGSEREATFREIARLGSESVKQVLVAALPILAPEFRAYSAEVLLRLNLQDSVEHVVPLLSEPDTELRYYVCGLLSNYGDKTAVQPLIDVLRNDPDADVRGIAAFALGKIGDRRAIPVLRKAQQEDDAVGSEGHRVSRIAEEALKAVLNR